MPWGIVYYQQEDGSVPAAEFLDSIPNKVEAKLLSVLETVRAAPPPTFSGGGLWEAMHGEMGGYYEVRTTGPGRVHYRLFCILENADARGLGARGFEGPKIAVITGMAKASGEVFSDREYEKKVRELGDDYRSTFPRRIAV